MNKHNLVVIFAAIVLLGAGIVGAMAFTGSDPGSGGGVHTMPDGSTMTGPIMAGGTHTMDDGSTMGDMEMP